MWTLPTVMLTKPVVKCPQEVWATGFGQYGQLGDRVYLHMSTPRLIKDLKFMSVPEVGGPKYVPSCRGTLFLSLSPPEAAAGLVPNRSPSLNPNPYFKPDLSSEPL